MKALVGALLLSFSVLAQEDSKTIPVFLEAAEVYAQDSESETPVAFKPELRRILELLKEKKVNPEFLERYLDQTLKSKAWKLPEDDQYDGWIKAPAKNSVLVPDLALHAYKFDVIEESDDFFNDDIYTYYFITDGVIPTGKVTSIYKGLDQGESFFFNEVDRAIYPLLGVPAKAPENHLIVDYGIVESDGDDIKEMQKLSAIIIDIAIAVYGTFDPQNAQILVNLRKEIKALAQMLLGLNHDDRLVTGTFGYKAEELAQILSQDTYVEFKKSHKKDTALDSWEYDLHFRLLRK